jgi:thiol-disulfide isomerase/thioredoxin
MNKNIILGGIIVVAVVAFMVVSGSNKNEVVNTQNNVDTVDQKDAVVTDVSNVENNVSGSYESYSSEKLAFAETGNVVLFFRASWCPTCRALDKDIKENVGAIPADLKILDVDYDNSQALKQKYGVTIQHTLVQVDKDGNMINKWSGSPTLLSLVSEVK